MASAQTYLFQFGGPILILIGTVGSILNLIIFNQKNLRKNPCSIYFIVYNLANFVYIYCLLFSLTLAVGYNIDPSAHNLVICRVRLYINVLFNVLSPYYLILASIDRILVTSRNALTRQRSTRRLAFICVTGGTLFWALFHSHALILANITQLGPISFCYFQQGVELTFAGYYSIIKELLALSLMIIFGLWAITNIRSTHRVTAATTLSVSKTLAEDPIHVTTKWRNRMLSKTAQMIMGQQTVSLQYLADVIDDEKLSKIDHELIISDLNPRDRQNFHSCLKITSEDVSQILRDNSDTQAIYVYLQLLKYIVVAYVYKSTPINDRLYYSWLVVFVSVNVDKMQIINAHALSGCCSTRVNFTIDDFLLRAEKIAILHQIECIEQSNDQENHLIFPVHHKHKKDNLLPLQNLINIDDLDVEEIISKAYKQAKKYIDPLKMSTLLRQNHAYELNDLSTNVNNYLKTTSKMNDRFGFDFHSDVDENTSTEEDDNDDDDQDHNCDSEIADDDDDDNENNTIAMEKIVFNGIRIRNSIDTNF
ncbi:unnamed protein product [Didymodactylos carnosus]|uniref:G-protein coupled receptors family 1 profile domain-containing protein n=1 Tax=Didymodactylos carnosus TaxID=1234261 RepID=A0A814D0V9_9BILA|nr:unnamed protein product [Didymodactylos carnosus]CAF1037649.1 unnamed protein product [Didymodactylos carnosus]CAF3729478.1 unnamed protein product [Didymodactylos carnosus]CAF3805887.1 unnamed protein product [Didymodactylos carnosus]